MNRPVFEQVEGDPEDYPCPDCNARAGDPCTFTIDDDSRYVHISRCLTPESNEWLKTRYWKKEK